MVAVFKMKETPTVLCWQECATREATFKREGRKAGATLLTQQRGTKPSAQVEALGFAGSVDG